MIALSSTEQYSGFLSFDYIVTHFNNSNIHTSTQTFKMTGKKKQLFFLSESVVRANINVLGNIFTKAKIGL